ncbi:hypothetical protein MBLL_00741 (plasmid) [Methylobacterium bullatum]|jgi:hypothetical protein|uniref:Uncharacterized protein n=2 Tax=Methylobacterium bullatum TaxID=570505 RepID=A0A679JFN9_9HYPH|nr:hypothetical protein MBLL_00741 [Methylobacterium bullatum]
MATVSMSRLTSSGFTEAQASAIADTVQASTNGAVETLREELVVWHAYLAFYILVQIGVVLLTILLIQTNFAPPWSLSATNCAAPN